MMSCAEQRRSNRVCRLVGKVVTASNPNQDDFQRLFRERECQPESTDHGTNDQEAVVATRIVPDALMDRQQRDICLTGLLLDEQLVSERQLKESMADWTIHGSESLLDHLVRAGVIRAADREYLSAEVTRRLQRLVAKSSDTAATSATLVSLDQLDPRGDVATLLGVPASRVPHQARQSRRFTEDYTLLRKLGQGGLGVVWLARDNSLKRYVAIKEVTEGARDNPSAISRFRREAVVTGRLEHPSIVPIHQFAEDLETGRAFYAMRFLGKMTLQDAITEYHERRESSDQDPMQLHHLLSAFVSVCQAIAYAHSKGVVHRDLKPENVALDGFGQVIVLDWGLAKLVGDADRLDDLELALGETPDQAHQTVAGQLMGTPMYMAPEQAAGRVDEIDERTDVYGLGAILFAIVTGYAPHELSHRSLSSQSKVDELLTAIMNQPTPHARDLNSQAPPELNAICSRALAKKRYARYQSASDLADDVQRWMAGEPVSAYDEPWHKRVRRWVLHHRRLSQVIAVLATVLLVAAITMGVVTHQNRMTEQDARFDSLRTEARELEIRLGARAATLADHVRFMSELPPIQGIIDAENGELTTDDVTIWRERLQTIFRGLLRSNQDYLKVSYSSVGDEVQELVRVERNAADGSFVRVLPESRLRSFQQHANLDSVLSLSPGDVLLLEGTAVEQEGVTTGAADVTLLAATPIYDEQTGEIFGVVGIEMNLERVLEYLLESATTAASVYVTDASGVIVMHRSRERGLEQGPIDRPITELVPELDGFFDASQPSDTQTDDSSFYATRVRLGSGRDSTVMGLLLTLDDSR